MIRAITNDGGGDHRHHSLGDYRQSEFGAVVLAARGYSGGDTDVDEEWYRHPQSESWIGYGISAVGFGISLLSVQVFNFENAAFAAYIFILNAALAVLAVRGRGQAT